MPAEIDQHLQTPESQLLGRFHAGDVAAGRMLIDPYVPELFDYALRTSLSTNVAIDATETTIRSLGRLRADLPEQVNFRAWVFGRAREEALGLNRERKRSAQSGGEDNDTDADAMADEDDDGGPSALLLDEPEDLLDDEEHDDTIEYERTAVSVNDSRFLASATYDRDAATWAWHAATRLRRQDYALFDLSLRRGISTPALGEVAGLSTAGSHAILGRLRATFEESYLADALSARGRAVCPELDALFNAESSGWRVQARQVALHAIACATCQSVIRSLPPAADVFVGLDHVGLTEPVDVALLLDEGINAAGPLEGDLESLLIASSGTEEVELAAVQKSGLFAGVASMLTRTPVARAVAGLLFAGVTIVAAIIVGLSLSGSSAGAGTCGGPITISHDSRFALSFDSPQLQGLAISSVAVEPVSPQASTGVLTVGTSAPLEIQGTATFVSSTSSRIDEYRLVMQFAGADRTVAYECTVLMQVPPSP